MPKQSSEEILAEVTEKIRGALGTNLSSLVLYGSHARGEAHARSDINLFTLVRESSPDQLAGLLRVLPPLVKKGVVAPVIMSEEDFRASQDTYALEFLEMAASHRMLAGRDPFEDFEPRWDGLRTELEHELRTKMIQLYRQWIVSGDKVEALAVLLRASVSSFLTLLRGIVALEKKQIIAISQEKLVEEITGERGLDPRLWRRVWQMNRETVKMAPDELRSLFRGYLEEIRKLVAYIDQFRT